MRMFNITPKPRMLLGVQNQKWTVSGALAELLDNAFGPGRGNADKAKIVYDSLNRTLTVLDNGRGMEYIGRLFQLGNTIGRSAGDIGNYGSGGTQAIIWLAEWVSVATERNGLIMHDRIRWSDIFAMEDFRDVAVSNEWHKGDFQQFSEWDCGTSIHLKLLKTRKIHPSNILRDLARLFAPGLRHGKQIIWCHKRAGEIIDEYALDDPFELLAEPENTVRFDIVVINEEEQLPVHGVISFDDNTSHTDSIVRVGLGYREIMRTRDCFKSEDELYAGIGVSGWLDLGEGWQPKLSTTKDGIDDQPLYDALMAHVFEKIRPLLLQSQQRTADFELDNLAIGLEAALERTMKMKVKVKRDRGNKPGGSGGGGGGGGSHGPDPQGEDDDSDAVAHIRLIWQDDDDMMGVLARADSDPLGLYVDINEQHSFVREAMLQRPINAAALNLMIVTEIAAKLTNDNILFRKINKSMMEELDCHESPERARLLVRRLIDSIPDKHQTAAE